MSCLYLYCIHLFKIVTVLNAKIIAMFLLLQKMWQDCNQNNKIQKFSTYIVLNLKKTAKIKTCIIIAIGTFTIIIAHNNFCINSNK